MKYEVLRVPPNIDSFRHAYDILKAYLFDVLEMNFNEFYKFCDSCYFLMDSTREYYIGAAYICRKTDVNSELLQYMRVYTLDPILFIDGDEIKDSYMKLYDLISTIIKDKNDGMIIVENIPEEKAYTNALKNTGFMNVSTDEIIRWVKLPKTTDDSFYKKFDFTKDLDTVDKMVRFHNEHVDESMAQEEYMRRLLEENKANHQPDPPQFLQTEEDFMRPNPRCDCKCMTCANFDKCHNSYNKTHCHWPDEHKH